MNGALRCVEADFSLRDKVCRTWGVITLEIHEVVYISVVVTIFTVLVISEDIFM